MGLIDLKFRNTTVSIVAEDELRTKKIASQFNQRLEHIAENGGTYAADNKIAFVAGLILEDELDCLKTKMAEKENSNENSEHDLNDMLNQVAKYIELLAESFEKK